MPKVTISFDSFEEAAAFMSAGGGAGAVIVSPPPQVVQAPVPQAQPAYQQPVHAPSAPHVQHMQQAPQYIPPQPMAPAAAPQAPAGLSFKNITDAAQSYTKKHGAKAGKAVMQQFGVQQLSDFQAAPHLWPQVIQAFAV